MKAVRYFTHSAHNAVTALAVLAVVVLVTFSGNFSAMVLPHSASAVLPVLVHFIVGAVLAASVFAVDECSEHFLHDRF